jgi:hypothetical protein
MIVSVFLLLIGVFWTQGNLHNRKVGEEAVTFHANNPYDQAFPDCTKHKRLVTESKLKVMVCPMIKDELGFLGEFAAYYKVSVLHRLRSSLSPPLRLFSSVWTHRYPSSSNTYPNLAFSWVQTGSWIRPCHVP